MKDLTEVCNTLKSSSMKPPTKPVCFAGTESEICEPYEPKGICTPMQPIGSCVKCGKLPKE